MSLTPKTYGSPDEFATLSAMDAAIVDEVNNCAVAVAADPTDRAARRRLREAQMVLRGRVAYWRGIGEELGTRAGLAITNYVTPDGEPILDTPEAQAYWAAVSEAAEAGVPWKLAKQQGAPEHGGPAR